MFQVSTILTEHDPKQFNGSNGAFTLHIFKDGAGNRYQTSKKAIADQTYGLLNNQVTITYHQEQRGQYTNNVIDSIVAGVVAGAQTAGAQTGAPTGAPTGGATGAPTTGSSSSGGSQSEYRRSKEEVRLTEVSPAAAILLGYLPENERSFEMFAKVVKKIAGLVAGEGAAAPSSAAASGGEQGAAAATVAPEPEPVPAGAPTSSELAPDDDIPF